MTFSGFALQFGRQELDATSRPSRVSQRLPDHTHPALADLLDKLVMKKILAW